MWHGHAMGRGPGSTSAHLLVADINIRFKEREN
jgi:hypothetical protein